MSTIKRQCDACGVDLHGHTLYWYKDRQYCLDCLIAATGTRETVCLEVIGHTEMGETDFVFTDRSR